MVLLIGGKSKSDGGARKRKKGKWGAFCSNLGITCEICRKKAESYILWDLLRRIEILPFGKNPRN